MRMTFCQIFILSACIFWLPASVGDVDGDGWIRPADCALLSSYLAGVLPALPAGLASGDMNADGKLDVLDLILLFQAYVRTTLPPAPGEIRWENQRLDAPASEIVSGGKVYQGSAELPTGRLACVKANGSWHVFCTSIAGYTCALGDELSEKSIAMFAVERFSSAAARASDAGASAMAVSLPTGIDVRYLGDGRYAFDNGKVRWAAVTNAGKRELLEPKKLVSVSLVDFILGNGWGGFNLSTTAEMDWDNQTPFRTYGSVFLLLAFNGGPLLMDWNSLTAAWDADPDTVIKVNAAEFLGLIVEAAEQIVGTLPFGNCLNIFAGPCLSFFQSSLLELLAGDSGAVQEWKDNWWKDVELDVVWCFLEIGCAAVTGGTCEGLEKVANIIGDLAWIGKVGVGIYDTALNKSYATFQSEVKTSFLFPADGAVLSRGDITVKVRGADAVYGISKIQAWTLDGSWSASQDFTSLPVQQDAEFKWNCAGLAPGSRVTLLARAFNAAGVWADASVTVTVKDLPEIKSFVVNPGTVPPRTAAELSWDVAQADSVTITPGVGAVALTGKTAVSPSESTTYTLRATNALGTSTATVRLTIRAGLAAGDLVETDAIVGNLRYVPAGTFTQGSPESEPCLFFLESPPFVHVLSRPFAMMETETTRRMWASLRSRQPSLPDDPSLDFGDSDPDQPAQQVSWYEAILFANLLSAQEGRRPCYYLDANFSKPVSAATYLSDIVYCDFSSAGWRLPTEGEWEYACRAGTTGAYSIDVPGYGTICWECPSSGSLSPLEAVAWFCANAGDRPHTVGRRNPNPWNFRDMHGNVFEWCWDWLGPYPTGTVNDYTGSTLISMFRAVRGGAWSGNPGHCRSAFRGPVMPSFPAFDLGFRLLRGLSQ